MKVISKKNIAIALYYSGILFLFKILLKHKLPKHPLILMGHRVVPENHCSELIDRYALESGHAITPEELERRIKFLNSYRNPADPCTLPDSLYNNKNYYITFDDGYHDNTQFAGPILDKYNIKAIIFVIKKLYDDRNIVPWWDGLSNPDLCGTNLSPSEYSRRCIGIKSMYRGIGKDSTKSYLANNDADKSRYIHDNYEVHSDTFYIGNHTISHPNINNLSDDEIVDEVTQTHEWLTGFSNYLPVFAYPFGISNQHTRNVIKKTSLFKLALATGAGNYSDRYNIRRVNLNVKCFPLFYAECLNIFYFMKRANNSDKKT